METSTWFLVFVLLMSGGAPSQMSTPGKAMEDKLVFKTEAECREVQQALMWDKEFIDQMFNPEYIIVPTCIETTGFHLRFPLRQR